ncbi:MAG: hypothetical protein WC881_04985, partial [Elusimicrobiota bacterium]
DGGLAWSEFMDTASGLGAGAALVMIDAPTAGVQAGTGVAVLAGAGPKEDRIVDTKDGHGLFTLEFIRALTGAADKKGQVTLRAAFEQAAAKVKSASGGAQTPVLSAPEGWDPVLVEGSASGGAP